MSSKDLIVAMKARNTRQALARAMRADPSGPTVIERHESAVADLARLNAARAPRAVRDAALAQVRRSETELTALENEVRTKWGMPARGGAGSAP